PALADFDGDGKLETVANTLIKTSDPATNDRDGWVLVVRSNGAAYPGWPVQPRLPTNCAGGNAHYGTVGSPIVADLDGDGHPEIVMAGALYLTVWNRNGQQISRDGSTCNDPTKYWLATQNGIYSTPTAADIDGDGHIELVVGGASSNNIGALYAWRFPTSVATAGNLPWPQFRHD